MDRSYKGGLSNFLFFKRIAIKRLWRDAVITTETKNEALVSIVVLLVSLLKTVQEHFQRVYPRPTVQSLDEALNLVNPQIDLLRQFPVGDLDSREIESTQYFLRRWNDFVTRTEDYRIDLHSGDSITGHNMSYYLAEVASAANKLNVAAHRYRTDHASVLPYRLYEGLKAVKNSVDIDHVLPVLGYVRLFSDGRKDGFYIQATNLDAAQSAFIPGRVDSDEFDCVMPFITLADLLPLLEETRIDLTVTHENMIMTMSQQSGRSIEIGSSSRTSKTVSRIKGLWPTEFPLVLTIKDEHPLQAAIYDLPAFNKIIKHVSKFADKGEKAGSGEYVLLRFDAAEKKLHIMAQNGFVISRGALEGSQIDIYGESRTYYVAVSALNSVVKGLAEEISDKLSMTIHTIPDKDVLGFKTDMRSLSIQISPEVKWQPPTFVSLGEIPLTKVAPLLAVAKMGKQDKNNTNLTFVFENNQLVRAESDALDGSTTSLDLGYNVNLIEYDDWNVLPINGRVEVGINVKNLVTSLTARKETKGKTSTVSLILDMIEMANGGSTLGMTVTDETGLSDTTTVSWERSVLASRWINSQITVKINRDYRAAIQPFLGMEESELERLLMYNPAEFAVNSSNQYATRYGQELPTEKLLTDDERITSSTLFYAIGQVCKVFEGSLRIWTWDEVVGVDMPQAYPSNHGLRELNYQPMWDQHALSREWYSSTILEDSFRWVDSLTLAETLDNGVWWTVIQRRLAIQKYVENLSRPNDYGLNLRKELVAHSKKEDQKYYHLARYIKTLALPITL